MSKFVRDTAVNEAKVVRLIEVKSILGSGKSGDPVVEIVEYYSLEGALIARKDGRSLGTGHWEGNNDQTP